MVTQIHQLDPIEQQAIAAIQYISKIGSYFESQPKPFNLFEIRPQLVSHLRLNHTSPNPKKIDKNLKQDLSHGWLMPYLFQSDSIVWGRWDYWLKCQSVPKNLFGLIKMLPVWNLITGSNQEIKDTAIAAHILPQEPIPQLTFESNSKAKQMLLNCLDSIPKSGGFYGLSSSTYLDYFLDWFFYGVGHPSQPNLPKEPSGCEGAAMRLYQLFDCGILSLYPWDYMGEIYAESMSKHGRQGTGFFPTPISLSQAIALMTFQDEDHRLSTVSEPSVGTGAMLLTASNYSLCAVGQDINLTCLRLALFQCYLYAPWYAIPIWWLLPWTDLLHGSTLTQPPTHPPKMDNSINARYHFPDFFKSGVINFGGYGVDPT